MTVAIAIYKLPGNTWAQGTTLRTALKSRLSGRQRRGLSHADTSPAVPLTHRATEHGPGSTSFTVTDLTPETSTLQTWLHPGPQLAVLPEEMLFFTIQAPLGYSLNAIT